MKILSKYVLREHVGPLTFALTALTSLMLLNFISRQFGELVGKGLGWDVIAEFFGLSIPFTVALTVPMSVLVAVLYAFSRLAAENEVTALKASGVSPWRLVGPALGAGVVASLALLAFNDQVLPRANHRLKTLQDDISQTKPSFLLKEQVINPIAEGKYYLKAGKVDHGSGRMREVVIYDMADPNRRRTIYADSGRIKIDNNRTDLDLDLFHGQMQEVATDRPGQLNRLFYDHDRIRIRDVARDFRKSDTQAASKGDREMGVCEMQKRLWQAEAGYLQAKRDYDDALKSPGQLEAERQREFSRPTPYTPTPEPRGLGWLYCRALDVFSVRKANAAEVRMAPLHQVAQRKGGTLVPAVPQVPAPDPNGLVSARTAEAKLRLDMAKRARNRFEIEINKKFALAAACLIFVIVGAPIAVRFPRGGVGLVIGVSLLVFGLYYVGLIGGEALANDDLVAPFWAMWATNVMLTVVGLVLLVRMGRDSSSNRGGDWGDRIDALKARFGRGPLAAARTTT